MLYACVLSDGALPDMAPLLPLARVAAPSWHMGTWARGAALYRAGRYEEAVRSFEAEARVFHPRVWDWAFLAMAHWKLNEKEKAHAWYDQAVAWMDRNNPQNEELQRFRAEATTLLGQAEAAGSQEKPE